MERPIFKPIGASVEELDTPALVVDLATLEGNIETMHSFFKGSAAKLRPHIESHRSPAIAHMQLEAGGTVGGICVTTLGQAEVFARSGFADIFVANVVVTRPKIGRLSALARHARMMVAVDSARNIEDLSEAATASGVNIDVVVNIHTGLNGLGVEPGQPAVDLAKAITDAESLSFAGLMTYEGAIIEDDPDELAAESRKWIQMVLDTRELVELAGMDVGTVSVGGTHNYDVAAEMDGVTEVPAGSYALMDHKYRAHRPELQPAARVMATVGAMHEDGVVVTDGGQKAIGLDTGEPSIDNVAGATLKGLSAEHGSLFLDEAANGRLDIGDKVWFTPWDVGACVNLHDYMHMVRDGRLEAVWDIPARGHYR